VWVRKVVTTSGATAVQVAESVGGRRRIVKHFGSAHTEADLAVLVDSANAWLLDRQGVLDIAMDLVQPKVALLSPPEPARQLNLFDSLGYLPSDRGSSVSPVLPGRVKSTDSRLLAELLLSVYRDLGFDDLDDKWFRSLVVAWVARPRSILKTGKTLKRLGLEPGSESTRRRALSRAETGGYRGRLADLCFKYAQVNGDISLCLYDVTTVGTQAEKEDDLRKVGFSKERSIDPQVVIGLLVDRRGFPLEIGCFPGNRAEKKTVIPIVETFRSRHGIENMVVVTDAGMLSADNLKELDDKGFRFIVGSRNTKAPHDLASHYRWHGDAFSDGQLIDTVTAKVGATSKDNDILVRAEPVWDTLLMPRSWRAVWAYSNKRFVRDNANLNKQEEKARAIVAGDRQGRSARFVTAGRSALVVNEHALKQARAVAGLKGYVTNIPVNLMSAAQVVTSYHDLWQVEASFRIFKSDLKAKPMHVWSEESIQAHITRAFAALAISREIQYRTGCSIAHVIEELEELRHATISINGTEQTYPPAITAEQQAIITAITHPVNNGTLKN